MGASLVYAQTPPQGAKDLRTIVDALKAMHSYGYNYEMQAKFEDGTAAVSYTHLDVYKRQGIPI